MAREEFTILNDLLRVVVDRDVDPQVVVLTLDGTEVARTTLADAIEDFKEAAAITEAEGFLDGEEGS